MKEKKKLGFALGAGGSRGVAHIGFLAAMEEAGVKPIIMPIRGGTDGARLSFMGLPCPNICTGGENFHSRFEYLSVQSLSKVVDIVERLILNATFAERK